MNGTAALEDGHRPSLCLLSPFKLGDCIISEGFPAGGALSPDVKPPDFTPQLTQQSFTVEPSVEKPVERIGNYLLLEKLCTASASTVVTARKAVNIVTQEEYVCKIFPLSKYQELLAPHWESGHHENIGSIVEIILGKTLAYVLFQRSYEDLHSYIRRKRRLRETEASALFTQILSAIEHCHERGIVLRDLKLRKFVFINQQRTHLVLDGLEDACLLDDVDDDRLTDKHGCPAYVSPEILTAAASPASTGYCGKPADMWSIGVILYTMLYGQYPFHDTVASQLFGKIRRGQYAVPDTVSATAKCLVRSLLRTEPAERLTVEEATKHPWFTQVCRSRQGTTPALAQVNYLRGSNNSTRKEGSEQLVPEWVEAGSLADEITS